MRKVGVEVFLADDGAKGVAAALANRVDAVLMDMQMPVMDGVTATRKLRTLGFERPIVAITANAMEKDRAACFAAGCSGYLAKPFEPSDLLAELMRQVAAEREPADRPPAVVGSEQATLSA